jgi:hypothetical protein
LIGEDALGDENCELFFARVGRSSVFRPSPTKTNASYWITGLGILDSAISRDLSGEFEAQARLNAKAKESRADQGSETSMSAGLKRGGASGVRLADPARIMRALLAGK